MAEKEKYEIQAMWCRWLEEFNIEVFYRKSDIGYRPWIVKERGKPVRFQSSSLENSLNSFYDYHKEIPTFKDWCEQQAKEAK